MRKCALILYICGSLFLKPLSNTITQNNHNLYLICKVFNSKISLLSCAWFLCPLFRRALIGVYGAEYTCHVIKCDRILIKPHISQTTHIRCPHFHFFASILCINRDRNVNYYAFLERKEAFLLHQSWLYLKSHRCRSFHAMEDGIQTSVSPVRTLHPLLAR